MRGRSSSEPVFLCPVADIPVVPVSDLRQPQFSVQLGELLSRQPSKLRIINL